MAEEIKRNPPRKRRQAPPLKAADKAASSATAVIAETPVVAAPTAAELLGEDANAKKIIKAKHAKNVATGVANILATFNNTQVTITDMQGNLIGLVQRWPCWFQRFT